MVPRSDERPGGFRHEAFVYGSDEEYVAVLATYVLSGLVDDDVVIAVVPARNAALLREAIGPDFDAVEVIDADEWYRTPGTTIAGYDDVLAAHAGARRVRVIGEVAFGDTAADWAAWTRYEAALNRAFERYEARVVCPYDARTLPPTVVVDACRTHPVLLSGAGSAPSVAYEEPEALARSLRVPMSIPTGAPVLDLTVDHDLRDARMAFRQVAAAAGFDTRRIAELTLAVNEVLTNALVHGGGPARLRVWDEGGGELFCTVDDPGPGADDPLVGLLPPHADRHGGRGVWLVRQLFDRAELVRSDAGHTVALATAI